MTQTPHATIVKVDLYTRICLTAIAVLLSVLVVGLWAVGPVGVTKAFAGVGDPLVVGQPVDSDKGGIPDAGAQRMATVNAVKEGTQRLDRIISLLESGKIRVVVSDEKGSGDGGHK